MSTQSWQYTGSYTTNDNFSVGDSLAYFKMLQNSIIDNVLFYGTEGSATTTMYATISTDSNGTNTVWQSATISGFNSLNTYTLTALSQYAGYVFQANTTYWIWFWPSSNVTVGSANGNVGTSNGVNWNPGGLNQAAMVGMTWDVPNNPPNAPTFSNITSNGSTINPRPKFFINVSDPDGGNTIQNVEIQCSQSTAFTTNPLDDQYGTDTGYGYHTGNDPQGANSWQGLPTTTNTSTQISYAMPSDYGGLGPGIWYVRARCKDNNGAWSAWSATQQFTVAAAPWSDTPNGPGVKAQWLNDIYNVIANGRNFRNWGTVQPLDGTLDTTKDMKAYHMIERRKYVVDEVGQYGSGVPSWSNTDLGQLMTANQMNCTNEWNNTNGLGTYFAQTGTGPTIDSTTYLQGVRSVSASSTYAAGTQTMSIHTQPTMSPVGQGQVTFGVWVRSSIATTISPTLWWYTANNPSSRSATQNTSGTTISIPANTWTFVTMTATVPTDATYAHCETYFNNMTNGATGWWGAAFLVQGNPFALDRSGQHVIDLRNACALM